jgi:hypothetical protein
MLQTAFASLTAGAFRILIMPIDTTKTILQVEGKNGLKILKNKVKLGGPSVLYHGAGATFSATAVGHYPWFFTFNYLDSTLPKYESGLQTLARNAFIGFTSSIISDTTSNSLRVVKTTKQSYTVPVTYVKVVNEILEKDGLKGLFGRGLVIRLMTNGIQGLMFSVIWKYLNTRQKID